MSTQQVPLSGTESAFVQMVLEEHRARLQIADQKRDARMAVLLKEKGIPDGAAVRTNDDASALVYDLPEMAIAE